MKNLKFDSIINNYINGNYSEFQKCLKSFNRIELIQFCCFCTSFYPEDIDIFQIEQQLNK